MEFGTHETSSKFKPDFRVMGAAEINDIISVNDNRLIRISDNAYLGVISSIYK